MTSILVAYKSFLIFLKKFSYLEFYVNTYSKSFSIFCSFLQVEFFLYHWTLDLSKDWSPLPLGGEGEDSNLLDLVSLFKAEISYFLLSSAYLSPDLETGVVLLASLFN